MKMLLRSVTCFGFTAAAFVGSGLVHTWLSGPASSDTIVETSLSSTAFTAGAKAAGKVLSAHAPDSERDLILSGPSKITKKDDGREDKVIMNDPNIPEKWGLKKTAATKAWEVSQGSKDIIVAVIDTGIDANHRDLKDNLWVNPGESGRDAKGMDKAANGVDDDGNGYVDDVHGWNFVHNNNNLVDSHGHGTHIAGIIGARGGNGFGISGVAPRVSLMVLKYYDPNTNNLENTIRAIRYAVQMNANIINYSGGGAEYSPREYAAIKDAEAKGVLFISAAGNEKSNSDEKGKHYYPADYELSNIISVTAVNTSTQVLSSSNYGVQTVDLAAPGENIYSTLPGNAFGMMTGTSQATAFVTGVAALIMANNRDFGAADVKKYILRTGDEHQSLAAKTGTSKVLNSFKALTSLDSDVAANGALVSNSGAVPTDAFLSSNDLRDPKLAPSALSPTSGSRGNSLGPAGTPGGSQVDTAEAFAGFGKSLVRAIRNGVTVNPKLADDSGLDTP